MDGIVANGEIRGVRCASAGWATASGGRSGVGDLKGCRNAVGCAYVAVCASSTELAIGVVVVIGGGGGCIAPGSSSSSLRVSLFGCFLCSACLGSRVSKTTGIAEGLDA